ncbi:MAG TPA: hypothetical protein VF158_08525 [Longimicrobiales bacterium]
MARVIPGAAAPGVRMAPAPGTRIAQETGARFAPGAGERGTGVVRWRRAAGVIPGASRRLAFGRRVVAAAVFVAAACLVPVGCGEGRGPGAAGGAVADDTPPAGGEAAGAPADAGAGPGAGQPPERAGAMPGAQDPGSAEAAAAVVRDYYAAIAAGDYARAYAHWADGGAASGQSFDEFRRGFARTASVRAVVGRPGRIEGAAGSRYVAIPVEICATTTDGAAQCFRGTYTLRRAVVPGASEEMRRWHIYSADIARCRPGAGGSGPGGDAEAGDPNAGAPPAASAPPPGEGGPAVSDPAARAAADLVRRFGGRLARVSLLAPPDQLRRSIRDAYGPLVTPSLLDRWLRNPSTAPGRAVSSPWPARIEVRDVRRAGPGAYEVAGDVAYVTSVEAARGGAAHREPVVLTVVRGEDGGWRIAAYEQG